MNLKTAALIAAAMVLISIPMTLFGQALTYIPLLREYFNWSLLVNGGVTLLSTLLSAGGLLLFLGAQVRRAARPQANVKVLCIAAGSLVLAGALLSGGYGLVTAVNLFGRLTGLPYLMIVLSSAAAFAAGVCLSVFIFLQAVRAAGVPGATVALAAVLFFCLIVAVNALRYPFWEYGSLIRSLGALMSLMGFFLHQGGALLFLFMYLLAPAPPAAADAAETLSAPPL